MSNNPSNKDPREHVQQRRAGFERRHVLLGGTALLTATAFSGASHAQTQAPGSVKTAAGDPKSGQSSAVKTRTAACSCGKLTLTYEGPDPERRSLCHCKNCQLRTGSAFSIQARMPRNLVKIEGKSTAWKFPVADAKPVTYRSCDSEGVTYHFCPECGSTVYWDMHFAPDFLGVAAGSFTDPAFPPPMISGFEEYRFPWAMNVAALPMPGGHHN
jgi:hypothetical protein